MSDTELIGLIVGVYFLLTIVGVSFRVRQIRKEDTRKQSVIEAIKRLDEIKEVRNGFVIWKSGTEKQKPDA